MKMKQNNVMQGIFKKMPEGENFDEETVIRFKSLLYLHSY